MVKECYWLDCYDSPLCWVLGRGLREVPRGGCVWGAAAPSSGPAACPAAAAGTAPSAGAAPAGMLITPGRNHTHAHVHAHMHTNT